MIPTELKTETEIQELAKNLQERERRIKELILEIKLHLGVVDLGLSFLDSPSQKDDVSHARKARDLADELLTLMEISYDKYLKHRK